jgi:hypothetical protein
MRRNNHHKLGGRAPTSIQLPSSQVVTGMTHVSARYYQFRFSDFFYVAACVECLASAANQRPYSTSKRLMPYL